MTDPQWTDYSHEVRLSTSPLIRGLLIGFAVFFLALGIIGIFLPLLPTTPFLLLASACYARSSARFYNWMMNHRRLGPPLRTWKENGAISRKNKAISVGLMASTVIPAIVFWIPIPFAKILVGLICGSVAIFVLTRPEA